MMYPSVDLVGHYLSENEFKKQKLTSGAWVHYDDLVSRIINGDYDSITPLHIEVCVTYKCNFNCSWCSCKTSMSENTSGNGLSQKELYRIIDECSQNNVGIQWTGGEPLMNAFLVQAIEYATLNNVSQCLFSNGSMITPDVAFRLMQSNLEFIRISLNCIEPAYHSQFHGNISRDLSVRVLEDLNTLCKTKTNTDSKVKIGISLVVDSTNIENLSPSIEYIDRLNDKYLNSIDYIVIRPINSSIRNVSSNMDSSFSAKYNQVLESELIGKVRKKGIDIVFPFSYNTPQFTPIICRGCTVFSEISPKGDLFLCSDRYGDMNYAIGNLLHQHFLDIYSGEKKKLVARKNSDCFSQALCPQNSRGWYFNCLFEQIENYRQNDEMDKVIRWIDELKKHIPNLGHSFFI